MKPFSSSSSSLPLLLLLASLLSLSLGFRAGVDYYGFGRITANYYTFGSADQSRGIYTFIYHAKTLVLEYNVITTLPNVGMVTINGPARCSSPLVGTYQQSDAACVSNTGPIVYNLGKGIVTPNGKDLQYQIFSGSVSMNNVEEDMLFNGELYVVVSKQVPDANNKYQDVPYLRGGLIVQGTQPSSQDYIYSIIKFEPYNKSKYPLPTTSQPKTRSSNSGVGYLFVSGTQMTMTANFYTSIPGNPSYLLRCGDTQKLLIPNENPGEQQITFAATEADLLLEYLIGNCFFFITSAANPDGDLFGYPLNIGMFESIGVGAKETPAVSSGGLFYAVTNFDRGVKILDIVFRHNLTTTDVTSIVVTDATTSTTLCTYTPPTTNIVNHFYCRLNDSQVIDLEKANIDINILTTQNPSGEIMGQINFMGKATTLAGSTAFSQSTAIGLGVGLGIGIPILLAVIVGVVFLVKKGGTNSKI